MASEHKAAEGALSGANEKKEHAAHVRKLHDGYHVRKHHADGRTSEHAAEDIDTALEHVRDHMEGNQMAQVGVGGSDQAGAGGEEGGQDPSMGQEG